MPRVSAVGRKKGFRRTTFRIVNFISVNTGICFLLLKLLLFKRGRGYDPMQPCVELCV